MMMHHAKPLSVIIAAGCLWTLGCAPPGQDASEPTASTAASPNTTAPTTTAPTTRRAEASRENDCSELDNFLQITDRIYTGGQPDSDAAFAALARLGVKTLVSVDGAQPDVQSAQKHALQYVHIPIGYDGVDTEAGRSLARLVRDADAPFYIHCHHGHHRGPAAAAIACIAAGDVDNQQALEILQRAGTSKRYAGLWRDVENYRPPGEDAHLPALVASAQVGSFAAAMAQIDRALDNLKRCRDAGWKTPADHLDLVPAHEALLLKEGLRESARNLVDGFDAEFQSWLGDTEAIAQKLEDSLAANKPPDEVSQQFRLLEESCNRCHNRYRN